MMEWRTFEVASSKPLAVRCIILADSAKLKKMSGGTPTKRITWDDKRDWLFVDDHETDENSEYFKEFQQLLKSHFVRVSVS